MPAAPQQQAWSDLLATGIDLLGRLGQAIQAQPSGDGTASGLGSLLARDEKTGAAEIRIPLPDAGAAQKLGDFLAGLGNVIKTLAERR